MSVKKINSHGLTCDSIFENSGSYIVSFDVFWTFCVGKLPIMNWICIRSLEKVPKILSHMLVWWWFIMVQSVKKRNPRWWDILVPHLGVSKNRGTPKWMVLMESPIKRDDLGFLETPILTFILKRENLHTNAVPPTAVRQILATRCYGNQGRTQRRPEIIPSSHASMLQNHGIFLWL